ncbi:hypothetical protein Tco_0955503 [Tanacetum coccineum]|uniref:Uncharacterized protein n=1 Tax=Tanacetum coccineum TaxID=301880 RepID=A0ABQ5E7E0_9ASTR
MAGVFNHWVVKFRGAKRPLDSCRNAAVNGKCEQDSAVIRTHSEQGSAVVSLGFSGQAYAARRRPRLKPLHAYEVDINKKTENQAKMTKLSMEWKRLCKIKAKVQKCQSQSQYNESAVKPESILKNTIGCNLNPSDGPGKPNSITMKTVKTLKAQS